MPVGVRGRCSLTHKKRRMEHFFTTYVRTKTVFKHRLKDLKDYDTVKVYRYELKKLGVDNGPLLYRLRQRGEIWYDDNGNFRALKDGPIDIALLSRTKKRGRGKAPLITGTSNSMSSLQ